MDWTKLTRADNPTPSCPKCGGFGEEVFNRFDCSNPLCSNFPRRPTPEPEPPDEDTKEMDVIDLPESGPICATGGSCSPGVIEKIRRGLERRSCWTHLDWDLGDGMIVTVASPADLAARLCSPEGQAAIREIVIRNLIRRAIDEGRHLPPQVD